ncbi:hypothetical protein SAMN04489712_103366 [Thermomonospora echinospora]|uniref:Uncharacterized protein n=1 Tax=Thermomonospora echinospora TaxID=1992 RepID=A0A1H5XRP1_9ACTN|nr:hypothetical protein [Thermomonospora echinospora]SEG14090.1 hypothetical protein SAMN04489712_103366 [Thermomonospora echinospora]
MATAQQTRAPRGRTAKTQAKTQAKTPARAQAKTPAAAEKERHGASVPIPVVTPRLKVLHVPVPGGGEGAGRLPPPERLAFYGGLGAMAAFNVISWPVAAAIGVGTAIAGRARRAGRAGDQPEAGAAKARTGRS